mgnify:CR=1 FL=1|jgi:hypothetical protein
MEDEEFLYRIRELAVEMDDLVEQYGVRDRLMSIMIIGVTEVGEDGDTSMKAVYSYNLHNKEELNELIEFMQDTYVDKSEGPDLDELLGGLGISLN